MVKLFSIQVTMVNVGTNKVR